MSGELQKMLDVLEEVDLGTSLEMSEQLSEEHHQALERLKVRHLMSSINKNIYVYLGLYCKHFDR